MAALAAAALLLWCHGLDASFHPGATVAHRSVAGASVTAVAAPAPPSHHPAQLDCCFGASGSSLLPVVLAKFPAVAAPWVAALLSVPLMLAALRPLRPGPQRLAPHRASLVEQSVLIRI